LELKKLIKLQNAIIKAHQKIKAVQSDNDNQTKEIKREFNSLNRALEQLSKELNSFTKKEDSNKQNEELGRLKEALSEVNKNVDNKIAKIQLKHGKDGIDGKDGKDGINGRDGKDGKCGKDGKNGKDGSDGLSAYDIAVKQGYKGTEKEWIDHITNNGGKDYSGLIAAMNQRINEMSSRLLPEIAPEGSILKYINGKWRTVDGGDIPFTGLVQEIERLNVFEFETKTVKEVEE
jgi:hypothetical protein